MRYNTFTPGPWKVGSVVRELGIDYGLNIAGKDGYHVAKTSSRSAMVGDSGSKGENLSNARLIAASPDMYDALWEVVELSDRTLNVERTPECQKVYDLCLAALRKAEGE